MSDRYRCSFEAVAETYERTRPGYAPAALAFIANRLPLGRVLDLGAGTGKLTRQLVALGADVVAVEPGDAMRAVLERVVPRARALAGSAEQIPLPDASVDAVTVGQAFHWFRAADALAEMHRVLRPGGGFALLWNRWAEDDRLLARLNELIEALRPPETAASRATSEHALDTTTLFGPQDEREFANPVRLDAEAIAGLVSSISAVSAAPPAEQARVEAAVRTLVGPDEVAFPLVTSVIVADRV